MFVVFKLDQILSETTSFCDWREYLTRKFGKMHNKKVWGHFNSKQTRRDADIANT